MAWKYVPVCVLSGALVMVAGCASAPAGRRPLMRLGARRLLRHAGFPAPGGARRSDRRGDGPELPGLCIRLRAPRGSPELLLPVMTTPSSSRPRNSRALRLPGSMSCASPMTAIPARWFYCRFPGSNCRGTFAVSPDGSKLVTGTGTATRGGIEVVSLASGAAQAWPAARGHASDLSWAGNRFVAFQWRDGSRSPRVARSRSGVRLLDTAAAGRDLMASRLIVHQPRTSLGNFTAVSSPLISANGSRLFATVGWTGGGSKTRWPR